MLRVVELTGPVGVVVPLLDGDGSGVVMVLGATVGVSPPGMDISGVLVWMVGARVVGSVRGLVSNVVMGVSPWGIDIWASVVVVPEYVSHVGIRSDWMNAHRLSMARPRTPQSMAEKTYPHPSAWTFGWS